MSRDGWWLCCAPGRGWGAHGQREGAGRGGWPACVCSSAFRALLHCLPATLPFSPPLQEYLPHLGAGRIPRQGAAAAQVGGGKHWSGGVLLTIACMGAAVRPSTGRALPCEFRDKFTLSHVLIPAAVAHAAHFWPIFSRNKAALHQNTPPAVQDYGHTHSNAADESIRNARVMAVCP